MGKKHLFRIAAPKFWKINRKESKFITKPIPGPHTLKKAVTLISIVKDYLNYSKTSREAKRIINSGKIMVDNIVRKEHRFPIGLMDVITIKDTSENYRILFDKKGKLFLHKIKKEEANLKPLKIINKTILKNKRIQLNFLDGRNKLIDKDIYKTSDTIMYDTEKKSFLDHIKFEKGAIAYIMDGKKIGHVGTIESINIYQGAEPTKIVLTNEKTKFETLKEYSFVIGKEKILISLPEKNEQTK